MMTKITAEQVLADFESLSRDQKQVVSSQILHSMGFNLEQPPYGFPKIVNDIFWGGLWGALFAAIWPKLPGGAMWLRGLIFGLLIALFSNWTLLPFIKGTIFKLPNQTYFAGFDPTRMIATLVTVGGFGLATGLIYSVLRDRS